MIKDYLKRCRANINNNNLEINNKPINNNSNSNNIDPNKRILHKTRINKDRNIIDIIMSNNSKMAIQKKNFIRKDF